MNARRLLACSLATLALTPALSVASPPVAGPRGATCAETSERDPAPDAPPDARTGVVMGGPAVWDQPFTLICTVQVNSSIHNGTTNDAARESASSVPVAAVGTHVAVLDARPVNYVSSPDAAVYICTSVAYRGGTIYWHPGGRGPDGVPGTGDEVLAHWSTDATRSCEPVTVIAPVHHTGSAQITITDMGSGPVVTTAGFGSDWFCDEHTGVPWTGVVCDWVSSGAPPECAAMTATGVSLVTPATTGPAWGEVDTWTICEGNWVAEFVDSGEADGSHTVAFAFDTRAAVPQDVTRVYCQARGVSAAGPRARYVADCGFLFA